MRTTYEHRFPSCEKALEYIKASYWDYVGRRGLLRKHDRYEGSIFYTRAGDLTGREYETRYALKLYQDGYVSLQAIKDTSGNPPHVKTALPDVLWASAGARNFSMKMVEKVNNVLKEDGSDLWVAFRHHPSMFPLHRKSETKPITTLKSSLEAIDYDPKRNGLSTRAGKILHRALNGHW